MALPPVVTKILPAKVCDFLEGMRHPLGFLITAPSFLLVLIFAPHIPAAREIALALALTVLMTGRSKT